MSAALTERRAADREKMAAELKALAEANGCTVERDDVGRCIMLRIEHPSGLRVGLDLDGQSCQIDVHVIPWFSWERRLAPIFGEVNAYHGRKATHVAHGWPALRAEIERGLRAAADGSAYAQEVAA